MHNFFRDNGKKILAIMGIFLMISFIATARTPGGGQRTAIPVGNFGKQQIFNTDIDGAREDLRALLKSLVVQPNGSSDWQPMLSATQPIIAAMLEDPKLFVLLQKEADQTGIFVTDQPIDEQISRLFRANVAIRIPDGRVMPLHSVSETDGNEEFAQSVQLAGRRFLAVLLTSNRAADVMKISAPLREFYLAEDHQQLQVRTVIFDAHKQFTHVPKPTTQQLQEQFNRFADTPPTGFSTAVNPFGFGYQIPERFKLEIISVSHDLLAAAVKKTKSDYDWDVAAHYYYDKHLDAYPTTRPAAAAATLPSVIAAPTTAPLAVSLPTTKPFEMVQGDVMTAVMKPLIEELADKIQHEIAATLSTDAATYHAAMPASAATQASTAPTSSPTNVSAAAPGNTPATTIASSLGMPFDSDQYLPALAAKVQKDTGVLPTVEQLNKPISREEAGILPGIGMARSSDGMLSFQAALDDPMLTTFAPSVPLIDDGGTTYFFRLRERIAAHRPDSMTDIASSVESNWTLSEAFDAARKQANALLTSAQSVGLLAAAHAANLDIDYPSPFSLGGTTGHGPIKGLPLNGDALDVFRQRCQQLLTEAAEKKVPVASIESPSDAKIIVTELGGITPDWPPGQRQTAEADVAAELRYRFARPLQSDWFTLEAVEKRLGYKDLSKDADKSKA